MVKLFCGPSHVFPPFSKCGVTAIVAVTGDVPGLSAVNAGMSSVPVAASPIDGVSLVPPDDEDELPVPSPPDVGDVPAVGTEDRQRDRAPRGADEPADER